jgi:hypothetical protein
MILRMSAFDPKRTLAGLLLFKTEDNYDRGVVYRKAANAADTMVNAEDLPL